MSSNHSVFLLIFLIIFNNLNKALCIECFICSSKDTEDCKKPDINKVKLVKCDSNQLENTKIMARNINTKYEDIFSVTGHDMNLPLNCLKQVIKEGNKDFVIRGCQLVENENLDICRKIHELDSPPISRTVHCSKCSEDRCNSGVIITLYPILIPITLFLHQIQKF